MHLNCFREFHILVVMVRVELYSYIPTTPWWKTLLLHSHSPSTTIPPHTHTQILEGALDVWAIMLLSSLLKQYLLNSQ